MRLIDSIYVSPAMVENEFDGPIFQRANSSQKQIDDARNIENHIKQKLDEMN